MSRQVNRTHLWHLLLGLIIGAWHVLAASEPLPEVLTRPSVASAFVADQRGTFWRATPMQGTLAITQFDVMGRALTRPIPLQKPDASVNATFSHHPQLVLDMAGEIYVTWASAFRAGHTQQIWFSRSRDGGQRFEPAQTMATLDLPPHCLVEPHMGVTQVQLTLAWVSHCASANERDLPPTSPITYIVSTDHGRHFSAPYRVEGSQVACAEITMTSTPAGVIALLWRQRFGDEDDFAMTELHTAHAMTVVRASFSHGHPRTCEHQAPSLALGEGFGYHLSYLDTSAKMPRLRLARMDGQAWVSSPAKKLGLLTAVADGPALLSQGDHVWLAWRSAQVQQHILAMQSSDGGKTWRDLPALLSTDQALYPPQALWLNGAPYVVLESHDSALLVLPLDAK